MTPICSIGSPLNYADIWTGSPTTPQGTGGERAHRDVLRVQQLPHNRCQVLLRGPLECAALDLHQRVHRPPVTVAAAGDRLRRPHR